MNDQNYCLHGAKHQFEARYDEVEPKQSDTQVFFGTIANKPKKNRIYVHDICICCGKVVKRAQ